MKKKVKMIWCQGISTLEYSNPIGYKGELLYAFREDAAWFRNYTDNSTIVMGSNTAAGLPSNFNLGNRKLIVVTRLRYVPGIPKHTTARSVGEAILQAKTKNVVICGGASVYSEGLIYAREIAITIVHHQPEHVDTQAPRVEIFDTDNPDDNPNTTIQWTDHNASGGLAPSKPILYVPTGESLVGVPYEIRIYKKY